MNLTDCPWPATTQMPAHYCEENLCAWVVQPINTWSNLGYLVVAILLLRQKNFSSDKYWFAVISLCLFLGSTLFHMTGTYWGRDLDVGAMLLLSGYTLGLSAYRLLNFNKKYLFLIVPVVTFLSAINIHNNWGGKLFVIQVVATGIVEFFNSRQLHVSNKLKKNLASAFLLFAFALALNLIDMNHIYCLPTNNFLTLHAIWHLICAYVIFLVVKYFCFQEFQKLS